MTGTQPAVLGLDLGTSQVKALVCTPGGQVLGRGTAGYPVRTPRPGWAESDPQEWWAATVTAVRAAMAPGNADIQGLAVAGQMHGAVPVSDRGEVIRPAILWLDDRSAAEAREYLRLPAELRSALGNRPSVGMAGPTLLWLSRHEPGTYRSARWLLQPKDWLRLQLTGEAATDPSDASGTLLYDLASGDWARAAAAALGLRTDLLPPLRQPVEIAGHLLPGAARHLGLPAGLPVAVGAADTAASLLAAGLPGPDWCLLTLGTGGQWVAPAAPGDPAGNGDPADSGLSAGGGGRTNLYCSADGGLYRLAAVQNVGVTLEWVTRVLGASWDDLYATAARPWQPTTPLFLPFLAPERWEPARAGGAWEGLSLHHGRGDLLRSAVEGVAFLLRAALADLRQAGSQPRQAVFAGGGSQHRCWRSLLSDVLQLPLFPAATPWLSARGATLIAGVAAGVYESWQDAARSVPPPGPAVALGPGEPATERYRLFLRMRDDASGPPGR
jgi:xylulokinase